MNELAVELNKPLIDSATDGYFGQVQCINGQTGACLACDSPPPPDETIVLSAPCTIVGKPRIKEHCAWKALYEFYSKYDREPDETSIEDIEELTNLANKIAEGNNFGHFEKKDIINLVLYHVPSLITVNAVTSGIQSQEIIKALFLKKINDFPSKDQQQIKSLIQNLRFRIPDLTIYSALTGNISVFELAKDPKCLVCSEESILRNELVDIEVDPSSSCSKIFEMLKNKNKKEYVGFHGHLIIPNDEKVKNVLQNGDRITASSLVDNEELRIKIIFQEN
jgi:molybdopterin/thiamine biosynthesis adenylyltransferase